MRHKQRADVASANQCVRGCLSDAAAAGVASALKCLAIAIATAGATTRRVTDAAADLATMGRAAAMAAAGRVMQVATTERNIAGERERERNLRSSAPSHRTVRGWQNRLVALGCSRAAIGMIPRLAGWSSRVRACAPRLSLGLLRRISGARSGRQRVRQQRKGDGTAGDTQMRRH